MTSTERTASPVNTGRGVKFYGAIAVVLIALAWGVSVRNNLANLRQAVLAQFGQVQNVMERRNAVLINFANSAAAGAANERGALTDITAARNQSASALNLVKGMDLSKLTEDKDLQKQFFEALATQQQALIKLNSVVEAYPEIKATKLFERVQDEISGSENRVSVERMRSQKAILAYNARAVTCPGCVVAMIFGYPEMPYYQASAAAQESPDLSTVFQPKKQ
jgi:LemA protein